MTSIHSAPGFAQTAAHFAVRDLEAAAGGRLPAIVHARDSDN
jgi:hypothetical protein